MKRLKEYRKYLKSEEWKEVRECALERTSGFCQFCGDFASQVHHTKYPKQFGEEHPNSLIPVCKRCHDLSHGVQEMKELQEAIIMSDLSPNGIKLNYLLSGGRVYASSKSWIRALKVPNTMLSWFENMLPLIAGSKKDSAGGELEVVYVGTTVYRWHAVAETLRRFDRQWFNHEFSKGKRSDYEKDQIKKFHENYERLVSWGYDLQERALANALNSSQSDTPITQENLIDTMKEVVAPRLREHDDKLREQDVVITEIKDSVPVLRNPEEFISVKQAIAEQGLDPYAMPFHPKSKENYAGLAGNILKKKGVKQGAPTAGRLDGQSFVATMNTYRRVDIYETLKEISENIHPKLF